MDRQTGLVAWEIRLPEILCAIFFRSEELSDGNSKNYMPENTSSLNRSETMINMSVRYLLMSSVIHKSVEVGP